MANNRWYAFILCKLSYLLMASPRCYDIDLIILTIAKSSAFSDHKSKEIPCWLVLFKSSDLKKNKITIKFFKNISRILTEKQPTSSCKIYYFECPFMFIYAFLAIAKLSAFYYANLGLEKIFSQTGRLIRLFICEKKNLLCNPKLA